MPFTNADLLAIKNELTTDPLALGLTTLPQDDEQNANLLNEVRETIQVDREAIPISDVVKALDRDEFNALSAADRQWLTLITQAGSVNPSSGGEIREGLLQLFGIATESRANLIAILTEPGSRIVQLYKAGTLSQGGNVTPSDIANSRQAT